MYHEYFGLKEPAFSIAVNPRYLFMSRQHKEALAHLIYGVQGGSFVLLSGEVGTGKTTIIRCLLEQIPDRTEIAFVLNPMANVEEMLATICEDLRIKLESATPNVRQMMGALQNHLLENHASGKNTVLLIDEAQLLSPDVLEQIRLLTNLETSTKKLLQIVLVGQPELNDLLTQPMLRQLSQRITARFHLEPLDLRETQAYMKHRLKVAGKKDGREIFPDKIIRRIHRFSGGIPRLINILCERLLIGAYAHNKYYIDRPIFLQALKEVERTKTKQSKHKIKLPPKPVQLGIAAAACVALVVALGVAFIQLPSSEETDMFSSHATATKSKTHRSPALNHNPILNYLKDETEAYTQLFAYHRIYTDPIKHPCWQTEEHNMSCANLKEKSWAELEENNRPVIMPVTLEDRSSAYVVVIGISGKQVIVLNDKQQATQIDKFLLSKYWSGPASYLWLTPKGYTKPINVGTSSPVVHWVAQQFAVLDGQAQPITSESFTLQLQARIKFFQLNHHLKADGIIGQKTLMKISEELGLSKNLLRSNINAS